MGDATQRNALILEVARGDWSTHDLREGVRALNAIDVTPKAGEATVAQPPPPKPLVPKRGTVGVDRVIADGDGLAVDLGFTAYAALPAATRLRAGDFVRLDAAGESAPAPAATKADLFLNNEFLARGHAVRKDEYALTDWDPSP